MSLQPGERTGGEVTTSIEGAVATILVDRPATLNAHDMASVADLADAVERLAADPDVRVIVMRGAGRAFSSGADLAAVAGDGEKLVPTLPEASRLVRAIRDAPQPVVAVVQGACAGVGVSIAVAADLTLASEKAFFMLAFAKVGLMTDGGASSLVAAAIGRQRTLRMALLAEMMGAPEAHRVGLIASVHPADELEDAADAVIEQLANGPRQALARIKHAVNAASLASLDEALDREQEGQTALLRQADFAEGSTAFVAKRTPQFTD